MHDIGFLCGSVCVVVSKSKNSLLDVSVIRYGREEAEKTNVNENRTTGLRHQSRLLACSALQFSVLCFAPPTPVLSWIFE